jgi:hypothetical protein
MKTETREKRNRPEFANEYEEWKEGRRPRINKADIIAVFQYVQFLEKLGKNSWVLRLNGSEYRNTTKRRCVIDWWITQGYAIDKGKTFVGLALVNFKMKDEPNGANVGDILAGDLLEAQEKEGRWWLVTKWTRGANELAIPEPEAWANDGNGANIQDVTPAVK